MAKDKHTRTHAIGRAQHPANSSNILAHEYSLETGHLTITFRGGRKYRYEGVPKGVAAGLHDAESMGGYLHKHVIDKFPAVRLDLDDQP